MYAVQLRLPTVPTYRAHWLASKGAAHFTTPAKRLRALYPTQAAALAAVAARATYCGAGWVLTTVAV